MRATLYGIPGSHPVKAAELMAAHKGIEVKRIDLAPVAVRVMVPPLGFRAGTVPAMKIDGRRVQTSRAISRALDELVPEPPLFPADVARRAIVEQAEKWGDEVLQSTGRRLALAALKRDRSTLTTFFDGPLLGMPPKLAAATAPPLLALGRKLQGVDAESTQALLEALPSQLDHVDELIADGVIGGAVPNAADFQILTSVRLLMAFADLDGLLAGRPAVAHAQRVVPYFPGLFPVCLPAEWLPAPAGA